MRFKFRDLKAEGGVDVFSHKGLENGIFGVFQCFPGNRDLSNIGQGNHPVVAHGKALPLGLCIQQSAKFLDRAGRAFCYKHHLITNTDPVTLRGKLGWQLGGNHFARLSGAVWNFWQRSSTAQTGATGNCMKRFWQTSWHIGRAVGLLYRTCGDLHHLHIQSSSLCLHGRAVIGNATARQDKACAKKKRAHSAVVHVVLRPSNPVACHPMVCGLV